MSISDQSNMPSNTSDAASDGQGSSDSTDQMQLAQATPASTSGAAGAVVTVAPPAAGQRLDIDVQPGQTILFQGVNLATAQIQQQEGGLLITLANGAVIFLSGFVDAAQSANPPVIELTGLGRQGLLGNEDFGGTPPDPQLGDSATISAGDLLAAAQGQPLNVQPAAGPNAGGDGGGARFSSQEPGNIGDGLGRADLLTNEDFGRTPPEPEFGASDDGDSAAALPELEGASGTVVEDELEGGSQLDPDSEFAESDPAVAPFDTSVTGTLVFSDGSITAVNYDGAFGPPTVIIDLPGGILFLGEGWSMSIDKITGDFEFTLNGPLDHGDPNATFGDDLLTGVFTATVTNADGSVDGQITINVHDDAPFVLEQRDPISATVQEDGMDAAVDEDPAGAAGDDLSTGNKEGGDTNTDDEASDGPGALLALFGSGADAPLSFGISGETGDMPVLWSKGEMVTYSVSVDDNGSPGDPSDDVHTLTGTAGGRTVFTLTVNGDGSWAFDLDDQLDHVDDDTNTENFALIEGAGQASSVDFIDFSSVVTATDADGDSAPTLPVDSFTISVQDDIPVLAGPDDSTQDGLPTASAYVDEDELAVADGDLSDGITDGDGDVDEDDISGLSALVSPGADEDVTFALDTAAIDGSGSVVTTGGNQVTSMGVDVKLWSLDANNVIGFADTDGSNTFNAGDREVFRLTDNGDGSFTFDLKDQVDHDNADTVGSGDTATLDIDLTSAFKAEDFDGDEVALNENSIFVTVENDVPEITVSANAEGAVVHDETALVQGDTDVTGASLPGAVLVAFNAVTDKGVDPDVDGGDLDNDAIGFARGGASVVSLDSVSDGADEDATLAFAFEDPAGADSGVDTTEGDDIFLFLEGDLIVGRVGAADGDAAFAIAVDTVTGELFLAQYLSIDHGADGNDPDSAVSLANDAVQVEVTATDFDGDSTSETVGVGEQISFEDDGPAVTVEGIDDSAISLLTLNLDESIDPDNNDTPGDGADLYNDDIAETESSGGGADGDLDDIAGQLAIDGTNAIGRLETTPGALAQQFSITPDAGSDGEQALTTSFVLTLSGEGLATTLSASQPAAGGNPDADGGDLIDFTPYADATIYLFAVDATTVEGRVGGIGGPVALRISLNDPDEAILGDETLIVEQFLAIDHGDDGDLYDTQLPLHTVSGSLGVTLTATVTDGDDDTAQGSHTTTLIDPVLTFVNIDDDGPTADISATEATLVLDESIGVDAGDVNADLDDIDAGNPDPFAGAYGTPIGAAAATLVSAGAVDFGTDGDGGTTFDLVVVAGEGADSGLATTDGIPILLFTEADGTVTGRTGDAAGPVVLAISVDGDGVVTVAQYAALQHPINPDNFDEAVTFAEEVLGVDITVTDGDGDTSTSLADLGGKIEFEDDGPSLSVSLNGSGAVTHDESAGLQTQADGDQSTAFEDDNDDDVAGSSIAFGATTIAALFAGVTDKGVDADVAPADLDGDAIGYARGGDSVLSVDSISFGSDGAGSMAFGFVDPAGADSGVDTTEGADIFLFLEGGVIVGRVGDGDGDAAFAIALDADSGEMFVAQYLSLDHGDDGGDHDSAVSLTDDALQVEVTATDGDGDSVASEPVNVGSQVSFEDDGPLAVADVAEVNESQVSDFNVVIVFDRSGSMSEDPDGPGGFATRLALEKAAVADLLAAYEAAGGTVNVLVVDFAADAATSGWTSVAGANAYLDPLAASGNTNYEAATSLVQSEFPNGTPTADANITYFLTDGEPTVRSNDGVNDGGPANPLDADNLTAAEQLAWETFLDANSMPSFGVGIGSGVTESGLEPVAFPGDPIVVTTETDLSDTLVDTVPPPNTVEGTVLDTIANDEFGSDGPATQPIISVVHHGGLTYTLADPTGGDGDAANDATVDGSVLIIPTELGGTLELDFGTGEYTYTAPALDGNDDGVEVFTYTIADGDGDDSTTDLTVTVLANDSPTAVNDTVITNVTDGSEIIISDAALVYNDTDPESDPLVVQSVGGAVNGSLTLGAFALPFVGFTPTGAFPGANAQFTYEANDGQANSGSATVDIIGDTAGNLEGTGGAEILIAGNGGDVLLGLAGDDVLIGGRGSDTMTGGEGSDMYLWSLDHIDQQPVINLTAEFTETLGGLTFDNEDIAQYDVALDTANLLFDGTALLGSGERVDALHVLDNGNIILSTTTSATLGGLSFDDADLVEYNPTGGAVDGLAGGSARHFGGIGGVNGFSTQLDDSPGDEDIDALHILDNGNVVFSTIVGTTMGGLTFDEGDLVEFNGSGGAVDGLAAGAARHYGGLGGADGFSSLFTDAGEDINAVHVLDNGHIVLSVNGDNGATLGGLTFDDGDLVEYDPNSGTASLFFSESLFVGGADIEAVDVLDEAAWVDTIDDFTTGPGGDVLNFADVFEGGAGEGMSLVDLEAGGFITFDSSSDVGGGVANDTVISIDADGAGGTDFSSTVVVNVLDVTLTSADTDNVII
jgi:T1SS-143 domain-containing protein